MSELPEATDGDVRRLQMAYAYAQTIEDAETLRKVLATTFAIFVEDISEGYEKECLDALRKAVENHS